MRCVVEDGTKTAHAYHSWFNETAGKELHVKLCSGTLNLRVKEVPDFPTAGIPLQEKDWLKRYRKRFAEQGRIHNFAPAFHPASLNGTRCWVFRFGMDDNVPILEVVAEKRLRDALSLKNGDEVELELKGEL